MRLIDADAIEYDDVWKEDGVNCDKIRFDIMVSERDIDKMPTLGKWIDVNERMPKEHDSSLAKFYGTPKWNDAMFRKISDNVLVTIEYEDGSRRVQESHTTDGKWRNIFDVNKPNVIAWMPMPEPLKEE